MEAASKAQAIRDQLPTGGLFAGHDWRLAIEPFPLEPKFARELEQLGRILHQFYAAADLLYRQSVTGKLPSWIADWLDRGKPQAIIKLQRHEAFKTALPVSFARTSCSQKTAGTLLNWIACPAESA